MLRQVQPSSAARATFTLLLLMLGLAGCKPENQTCTDHNSCLAEGEMCIRGACCNPEDPDADQLECAPTLEAECGNGTIDPGETCDGDCPTTCDDNNKCTTDTLTGSENTCDAVCTNKDIENCTTEPEPEELCGNGTIDPGETCDGDCPTSCDDGDKCTNDALTGSESSCDAVCTHNDIEGCTTEPEPEELCGNGTVDRGETCDGDCPTTCDDGNLCTTDAIAGSPSSCDLACNNNQIPGCTVLVTETQAPRDLLIEDSNLYWTTMTSQDALGNRNSDGHLNRLSLDRGIPEILVASLSFPDGLTIANGTLYVVEKLLQGSRIRSIDINNPVPEPFALVNSNSYSNATDTSGAITTANGRLYWVDDRTLWTRLLDHSEPPAIVTTFESGSGMGAIQLVYSNNHLYRRTFHGIDEIDSDGTHRVLRGSGLNNLGVVIDSSGFYSIEDGSGEAELLYHFDFGGAGPTTLERDLGEQYADHGSVYSAKLSSDTSFVYASKVRGNEISTLHKVSKIPGTSFELAMVEGVSGKLVVDYNYIYWIVDNSILRIDKCADGPCCALDGSDDDKPECQTESKELCGNGKLDPGEICDGDCPTSCDGGDLCTVATLTGSAEKCDSTCESTPIVGCTVLVRGELNPSDVQLDSETLYWTNAGTRDALGNYQYDGQLRSIPKAGGTPSTILEKLTRPEQLIVDGNYLYFHEYTAPWDTGQTGAFVSEYFVLDQSLIRIATGSSSWQGYAIDDDFLYTAAGGAVSFSSRKPLDQDSTLLFPTQFQEDIGSMSLEGGYLYWGSEFGAHRRPRAGGPIEDLCMNWTGQALLVNSERLYLGGVDEPGFWGIVGMNHDGDQLQTLARDAGSPSSLGGELEEDDAYLYACVDQSNDEPLPLALVRIPKTPGPTVDLFSTTGSGCKALAIDDNYIYWIVDNSIVRIEK